MTLSSRYEAGEARAIADLVLEEVTELDLAARILHGEEPLPEHQRERIEQIAHQLAEGIPVQHTLGYETFCGRRFAVSSDVLIPRPETAELVRWIEDEYPAESRPQMRPLQLLDIGTGSGCIALTLAADMPDVSVTAFDVSEAALGVARSNAESLGVSNVRFSQCDILTVVPGSGEQYDVIVSNPPYICEQEKEEMESVVLDHEPSLALFVPDHDPMLFYRAIGQYAMQTLRPRGHLYFEINEHYGEETIETLRCLGFVNIRLRNDFYGKARMVSAAKRG